MPKNIVRQKLKLDSRGKLGSIVLFSYGGILLICVIGIFAPINTVRAMEGINTDQYLAFLDGTEIQSTWQSWNTAIANTIGFSPATIISFFAKVVIWILELAVNIIQFVIKAIGHFV